MYFLVTRDQTFHLRLSIHSTRKIFGLFRRSNEYLGHDNIAIPHNGNVSDGWMYSYYKFLEGPIDERYARRQQQNTRDSIFDAMKAKAPKFLIWAVKDPESGNLDRIQIVKEFVNKWGRPDEKIYDVAWSDDRKIECSMDRPGF